MIVLRPQYQSRVPNFRSNENKEFRGIVMINLLDRVEEVELGVLPRARFTGVGNLKKVNRKLLKPYRNVNKRMSLFITNVVIVGLR